MTNTILHLKRVVEGLLFAASAPLSVEALSKMFPEEEKPSLGELRQVIAKLQAEYETRGINLVEVATGYRFQVAPMAVPLISKSQEEKPARYSRALLETLALIAYRQPITRGEIEDIRGVVVSTHIIKTLDEHEWIKVVGHKDVPGKPALYATTKYFLDHFGLKSLDELPPLAELKDFENLTVNNALPEDNTESEDEALVQSDLEKIAEEDMIEQNASSTEHEDIDIDEESELLISEAIDEMEIDDIEIDQTETENEAETEESQLCSVEE